MRALSWREMRHFALSNGESIVRVHGVGPFKVNCANPSEVQPSDAPTVVTKPKS